MKNMSRFLGFGLVSCATLFLSATASAFGGRVEVSCSATVPDKVISGDDWYGPANFTWCTPEWLKVLARGSYQMSKDEWDNGFGWDDACNTDLPFARLATTRVALEVSSPNPKMGGPFDSIDISKPMLDWALLYTVAIIDDLRASCGGSGKDIAYYQPNLFGSYMVLNVLTENDSAKGFFYGMDVPSRAATLIHEARHWDGGPDHVGDGGKDQRFKNGGSYSWETIWLWWYADRAVNAPDRLRCAAEDSANALLGDSFVEDPGFTIAVPFCH
jgi:hypothetical protein